MPTYEVIFSGVQEVLCDTLGVEEDEVTLDAHLTDGLGAESIDYLDVVYRLEKKFQVKIPREEFLPASTVFDDPSCVDRRKEPCTVTPRGMERLQQLLPWANVQEILGRTPLLEDVRKLMTVKFLCDCIDWKLKRATARVTS